MVNTPIPHSLKSESKKAAKILKEFTIPSAKVGPDKIIPVDTIANAAGLAILSVFKIGFLLTARGGSGIVIARLDDGTWSPPSAIGMAGLGGGFDFGAEVTDFVIILNKKAAVEAFSKGGNLTLGGNFTVAAGPVGRNMEGDIAIRSTAAIYTYSKTKGLFAGVSIEGSYLIERKDANKKFYKEKELRAYDILQGNIERPDVCFELYEVLEKHQEMYLHIQEVEMKKEARKASEKGEYEPDRQPKSRGSISRSKSTKSKKSKSRDSKIKRTSSTKTSVARGRSSSQYSTSDEEVISPTGASAKENEWDNPVTAKALWGFEGLLPCDLCFNAGDEISIMTRTATQEDWWEGTLNGRIGIFPANYTQVIG